MTKAKADNEMPLMDHLRELRRRLLIAISAIVIAAFFAYGVSDSIFYVLCKPFFDSFSDGTLIGTGPADAFLLKIKMAIVSGAVLSSPIVFYQIWLFISPGLRTEEKKLVIPFLLSTTSLFLVGMSFCYVAVLPVAMQFFSEQYGSIKINPTIRITEHISFMAQAILAFGLIFEMPILAYFLGRFGVVTSAGLIKGTRIAIVVIFILSAILTPPDVLTQFLMAGPLLILYGLSILVVKYAENSYEKTSSDKEVQE